MPNHCILIAAFFFALVYLRTCFRCVTMYFLYFCTKKGIISSQVGCANSSTYCFLQLLYFLSGTFPGCACWLCCDMITHSCTTRANTLFSCTQNNPVRDLQGSSLLRFPPSFEKNSKLWRLGRSQEVLLFCFGKILVPPLVFLLSPSIPTRECWCWFGAQNTWSLHRLLRDNLEQDFMSAVA